RKRSLVLRQRLGGALEFGGARPPALGCPRRGSLRAGANVRPNFHDRHQVASRFRGAVARSTSSGEATLIIGMPPWRRALPRHCWTLGLRGQRLVPSYSRAGKKLTRGSKFFSASDNRTTRLSTDRAIRYFFHSISNEAISCLNRRRHLPCGT